ncbi:solute carrier family 35 member F2-like isoform X2 [Chenopodium quinoa]|uniref:solute carrier family 35 member F2-like isoform X2 n=1 Tax=Chenopodium quinoa TaxID=63459 RepID=UPI000B780E32|nr:solute carrier family 35 member F2-like isoform X2 [Chenopodium quinoa]
MECRGCCNWLKNHESLCSVLFTLFLGQIISFTLATTSFAASYLATRGVDAPVTQSFFTYLGLTSIYGSIMLFRRKKLLVPWYYYALLAFVDVQGNFLCIKAFQYTSITSVTLFDCWTIVWVMILTWVFLGTRYNVWQYIGAATCVVGLCFALLSDARIGGGGGSRPLFGDFLVTVATLFYALSNVGEEFCVKQKDIVEVISMLGVFGMLILVFAGFAVGTCLFYSLLPLILKLSGATLFNLSILTSDMWAVIIRILFYHEEVNWLYYVSFAIVVMGLVIYCKTENKSEPIKIDVDGHSSIQYEVLGEESLESRDGSFRP